MGDELKWLLKVGDGRILRTLSFENRPTQVLKNQICNVITSKIAAKLYSKNSNLCNSVVLVNHN